MMYLTINKKADEIFVKWVQTFVERYHPDGTTADHRINLFTDNAIL